MRIYFENILLKISFWQYFVESILLKISFENFFERIFLGKSFWGYLFDKCELFYWRETWSNCAKISLLYSHGFYSGLNRLDFITTWPILRWAILRFTILLQIVLPSHFSLNCETAMVWQVPQKDWTQLYQIQPPLRTGISSRLWPYNLKARVLEVQTPQIIWIFRKIII